MYLMTVIGNLTADPVTRTVNTPNGVATVTNFTLACKNKRMDKTFFPRITAWDEKGKTIAKYMKKGYRMMVSGEPTVSAYGGRDGSTKGTQELKLEDFEFLTSHSEGYSAEAEPAIHAAARPVMPAASASPVAWEAACNDPYETPVDVSVYNSGDEDDDDDLPF